MAKPYTVEADGRTVSFEAPDDATPDQIRTLAARALKREIPGKAFARPVLERRLRENFTKPKAELKAEPWTLQGEIANRATNALSAFGMDERGARQLANKATGFLNDFTPVGSAVLADEARSAFGEGNYLEAAGKGALAAFTGLPGAGAASKAMFLGVMAKNADRATFNAAAALEQAAADKLRAAGMDGLQAEQAVKLDEGLRRQIWDETGWFRGADGKWRFEVPDDPLKIRSDSGELPYGIHPAFDQPVTGTPGVVEHPALNEGYPATGSIRIGPTLRPDLNGYYEDKRKLLALHPDLSAEKQRSTLAHELQHFVQEQEGFARGGMVGAIPSHEVRPEIQPLRDRFYDLAARIEGMAATPERFAIKQEMERLNAQINEMAADAPYEGYRRLAGEVEARNVQTRLDMTPGQRKEYAPWETEDVPRDQQFVLWHGDGGSAAIEPLWHGSDKQFDQFSNDFIGQGEGAQGYGFGHYLTESRRLASSYRNPRLDQGPLSEGALYRVRLNADPGKFIDWERPLADQPHALQSLAQEADLSLLPPGRKARRLIEMFREGADQPHAPALGSDLHNALTNYGADVDANRRLSEAMAQQGYAGFRYGQPRDALGGGGLNYVVFDPKLIDILERY